jgi:hypothetical protein
MTREPQNENTQSPLRLPLAAFCLVLFGGGVVAIILSFRSTDATLVVLIISVVAAVAVALGIIFDDRKDFRTVTGKEQEHAHTMQRMAQRTERIRILNQHLPRAIENVPPNPNWQQIEAPRTWSVDGTITPRDKPTTLKLSDGREARIDLIEALIDLGFCGEEITDVREEMRQRWPAMHFRNTSLLTARDALREWEAIDQANNWIVDEDEARGLLTELVSAAPRPTNLMPPSARYGGNGNAGT